MEDIPLSGFLWKRETACLITKAKGLGRMNTSQPGGPTSLSKQQAGMLKLQTHPGAKAG